MHSQHTIFKHNYKKKLFSEPCLKYFLRFFICFKYYITIEKGANWQRSTKKNVKVTFFYLKND